MVTDKVLGNLENFTVNSREVDKVYMEWFELEKKRIKKQTDRGEEIGIVVPADVHLKNHDVIYADQEKIIAIEQLPCELTVVRVDTMKQMGRLCFELGNRHLSLAISDNEVRVVYDEPTFLYLKKLGFDAEKKRGLFENYTVCHAHGHGEEAHHGHTHGHHHHETGIHEHKNRDFNCQAC